MHLTLVSLSALLTIWALPPDHHAWLIWIALIPLIGAIDSVHSMRRAFVYGGLFGTLVVVISTPFLVTTLERLGQYSTLTSTFLFIVFAFLQAGTVWGLFAALYWQLRRRSGYPASLLAAISLVCGEFLIPMLFEWNLGLSQVGGTWIAQVADLGGVVAVSFLIAMVNGALFDLGCALRRRHALPWRSLAAAVVVLVSATGYGGLRMADIDQARAQAQKLRIGVVQGNFGPAPVTRRAERRKLLQRHMAKSRQLRDRGAELIVWPEMAFPFVLPRTEPTPSAWTEWLTEELGVPVLIGAPTSDEPPRDAQRFNSALLFARSGRLADVYDKHMLFPFMEFTPRLFTRFGLQTRANEFAAGSQRRLLTLDHYRIGALICIEDMHPAFVRELASLRPNLLASLGSDAQLGAEIAPKLHLAVASFRSIEMRLDMVRASQNGISAIIDANGRVTVQTRAVEPSDVPRVRAFGLTGTVALLEGPQSFYARHGDVFGWLNLLAAAVILMLPCGGHWRRRRAARSAAD